MPAILTVYRELQKIDEERLQLQKQLGLYPGMLQTLDKREEAARQKLQTLEKDTHEGELERRKLERDLAAQEEKERHLEEQRMMVKTPKELGAIEHEIAAARERVSQLEDRILELMTAADERAGAIARAKAECEKTEAEAATERARIAEQVKSKQAALELLEQDRAGFRAKLDLAAINEYNELAGRYPGKVVVTMRDKACGGCHTELLPTTLVELNQDDRLVRCPHCRRFLTREGAST